MARGYNKVIIMGNLSKDPQVRYTASKQAVASLNVAVNRTWKDKRSGELQEQVDFIPVVVWGASAENCERYLKKGKPVLVEGRIQVRSYDDKEGQRRWVTEVVASDVNFLPSGEKKSDGGNSNSNYDRPNGKSGNFTKAEEETFSMDISEMPGGGAGTEPDDGIPF